MKLAAFYDTETTGLPLFSEPSEDPRQPHIVQLAAILVDLDSKKTVQSIDLVIKPHGWVITPEITEIHGITQEYAMDVGVSEDDAASILIDMVGNRLRIGHNEQFDARIIRIAAKRYFGEVVADTWKSGEAECTARLSTKLCNLPPTEKMIAAKKNFNKTPNLTEAYTHFFGKGFDDAHTAMADVLACRDVYFAVKEA